MSRTSCRVLVSRVVASLGVSLLTLPVLAKEPAPVLFPQPDVAEPFLGSLTRPMAKMATETLLFPPGEIASNPLFQMPDPFSTTMRILTSLVMVISLLFAVSWFIQKRTGLNRSVFGKTLGIMPLDSKRFIYLVDVMGKVLVLGVTEQNINLLCEISDKAKIDALRLQNDAPTVPGLEEMFPFLKKKSTPADDLPSPDLGNRAQLTEQQRRQVEKLIIRRDDRPPENRQL